MLVLVGALTAVGSLAVVRHLPEEAQAAPPPSQDVRQIQGIALDGGRDLPSVALRAVVSTQVGDSLDDQRLERDRAAIEAELEARGYLAAKVASASVTFAPRGAYVVFDVEAGPMFHLRSVTVTGPGQREAGVVRLAAGDEASASRIARARQSLSDALASRGKQVELRVTTDEAAAAIDLELATR
ncbi:MAG TPA: POTRA domain-containing protein [Kofleriaceae bacterium]|nr:POTRA domain-containing protein [Kofleriaceae bacterium]